LILDKKPKGEIPFQFKSLHVVSSEILAKIGQLKNSRDGILATLPIPMPKSIETFEAKRMIIIDGVDSTNHLGAILRSVSAFDWEAVWVTHSCADPFDPISIRASQGALFDIPYRVGSIENALLHVRRHKTMIRLKFNPSVPGKTNLSLFSPDLSESLIPLKRDGEVCLLIQGSDGGSTIPRTNDFLSVGVGSVADGCILPIPVSVSSILCSIRDRYF
jgi:hypothetical protein